MLFTFKSNWAVVKSQFEIEKLSLREKQSFSKNGSPKSVVFWPYFYFIRHFFWQDFLRKPLKMLCWQYPPVCSVFCRGKVCYQLPDGQNYSSPSIINLLSINNNKHTHKSWKKNILPRFQSQSKVGLGRAPQYHSIALPYNEFSSMLGFSCGNFQ